MNFATELDRISSEVIAEMGNPALDIRPGDITGRHRWGLLRPLRAEVVRRMRRETGITMRMLAPLFSGRDKTSLMYWERAEKAKGAR